MDYNQKIQLLEERIRDLTSDLEITKTVVRENLESILDLDKKATSYHKEAGKLINEAKDLIAVNKTQEAKEKLNDAENKLENGVTVIESLLFISKRGMVANIENYYKQNEIIRHIAPEVSEEISIKIKSFEEKTKVLLKKFSIPKPMEIWPEISKTLYEAADLEGDLATTISLAKKCIKSTIDKIKN